MRKQLYIYKYSLRVQLLKLYTQSIDSITTYIINSILRNYPQKGLSFKTQQPIYHQTPHKFHSFKKFQTTTLRMQQYSQGQTQQLNFLNDPNNSLNQTAVSLDQPLNQLQLQDEDSYAEEVLKQFYGKHLKIHADLRFIELEKQKLFDFAIVAVYPPQPLVYFLPYTIIVDNRQSLHLIRDRIKQKYQTQISAKQLDLNMYVDNKDQLFISLHSAAQLIYYKIRRATLPATSQLHRYPDCLDKDVLVDRLYHFYKTAYKKFHFQQVSVFFFYWAYVKKFLNQDYLSPSAIKMMAIWMFMDFGYGVENVLTSFEKYFWESEKKCLQMARTNRKGECIIDKQILKYQNYSIEQKKGLYIVSQRKYQMIRMIEPVLYPIGLRNPDRPSQFTYRPQQLQHYQKSCQKAYKRLTQRNRPLTRYQLLFQVMKTLHKYLNYPNKLIFDIKRPEIMFIESSNEFLLDIQHPVFKCCLSKGLVENGSTARRIKGELNELMRSMKESTEAVENVVELLRRR